jgi:arginine transport system substrate-binding protein
MNYNIKKILAVFAISLLSSSALALSGKTLKFATEPTYPPFEMVAPTGEMQGFDIDIANAICTKLKVKCEFISQPFDSLIPSLNMGKFDAIIASMNITAERKKSVDFSLPYYNNSVSFVTATGQNITPNKQTLVGKVIGAQQGSTIEQYLKSVYGDAVTVKSYASIQNAFIDLVAGRLNFVMGDTLTMQQLLKDHGNGRFQIVGSPVYDATYFGLGYGIAVKKGNTADLKAINSALTKLRNDGTLNKIINKYFGQQNNDN